MNYPQLFKKSLAGKAQVWSIATDGNVIVTTYGQVGGAMQETRDTVAKGKNLGKANATTPVQQAELEAKAKWELKKAKSGYVEQLERATAGETDAAGGIAPMLAKKFRDDGQHIVFPCAVQPKLDGIRCIAVIAGGAVSMWTRTRKPIKGLDHIRAALLKCYPDVERVVLDGELYNHALKKDFERIVSAVRGGKDTPDAALVQYHVYDVAGLGDTSFSTRSRLLWGGIGQAGEPLVYVTTHDAEDEMDLMWWFNRHRAEGYEGAMARNLASPYAEGARSKDLQKLKEFEDAEFTVVGMEEGRGRLAGHVGAFVCEVPGAGTFKAKMMGETAALAALFTGPDTAWRGKALTVRYQGMTNGGVPRFPVGVRFREAE